jgi:hypothetical protein
MDPRPHDQGYVGFFQPLKIFHAVLLQYFILSLLPG